MTPTSVAEMRHWCIGPPYDLANGCEVVCILTEPDGAPLAVRLYVRARGRR